ncbi:hypothetical protein BGZ65_006946, partial [Modicella reniformis]
DTTTSPLTQPNTTPAPSGLTPTIATVISGTSTVIPRATSTGPLVGVPQTTTDPNGTEVAGLPPSLSQNQPQKSGSNVPAAALGAVGAVAALALIVFGLVMTRRRKRLHQEQQDREGFGAEFEKHGHVYDPTMVTSADDYSLPSLHHAPYVSQSSQDYQGGASGSGSSGSSGDGYAFTTAGAGVAGAAAGVAMFGSGRHSDESEDSLSLAVANAGNVVSISVRSSDILLPFPIPPSTSDALRQQYDLANRMSVASQESMTDSLNPVGASVRTSDSGAMAAAAAVSQQLSLKRALEQEDAMGCLASEYSDVDDTELSYLHTGSPSQTYISARNSPMANSSLSPSSALGTAYTSDGAATRSSAYVTVRSASPTSAIADSPTLSHASLTSQDINIPSISPSDWRLTGSGRPESNHIRQLIRNVLDGDD